jgi:hypothetical protein
MQKSHETYSAPLKKMLAIALAFVFVFTTALLPVNTAFADEGGGAIM